jgi:hypothetical protein
MIIGPKKVWKFYRNSTFGFILFVSTLILIIGLIGFFLFWCLGTLSGMEEIAISGMILTSFLFILSTFALLHKSKYTWRLFISIPFVALLIFLAYDSAESAIGIIFNGRNLCPTCP